MKKYIILLAFIYLINTSISLSEETESINEKSILSVGPIINKSVGLYWSNGFLVNYTPNNLKRLSYGFRFHTTRLGSAISSNAIQQENYILNVAYEFLKYENYQSSVILNAGYFYSDYESDIFKDIPNSTMTLALELSQSFSIYNLSFGYNFIHGDGSNGIGTLYPFYFQFGMKIPIKEYIK